MSDEAMNNFTPRAQQVLALARKEADRFNHNFVGTEHLLLGLIEARSQERLALLGESLSDPDLARLYQQLSEAEARHGEMFRDLAAVYEVRERVDERLFALALAEAEIVASLPLLPRIH